MKNARKGFTITEVIIAAAVSTIILFGSFAILQASNRQLEIIHAKMSLQEGPREALFKMAQEIRQTAWLKIEDLGNGESITFSVPVPAPDAASLVDNSFAPKWAHKIRYSRNPETRQILRTSTNLTTNEVKTAVLANEITALTFSKPSSTSGLITIRADAQRVLASGELIPEEPIPMTTQSEARNP